MYQGRETVLKYDIFLGLASQVKGPPIQRDLLTTSPFDLQCHTGAKEVKAMEPWRFAKPFTWFAKPRKISYLSTFSRPWYISWCKCIPKIDF